MPPPPDKSHAEINGTLVIVTRDRGETRAMTSDRAWAMAVDLCGCGNSRDLAESAAKSRTRVWAAHVGCSY